MVVASALYGNKKTVDLKKATQEYHQKLKKYIAKGPQPKTKTSTPTPARKFSGTKGSSKSIDMKKATQEYHQKLKKYAKKEVAKVPVKEVQPAKKKGVKTAVKDVYYKAKAYVGSKSYRKKTAPKVAEEIVTAGALGGIGYPFYKSAEFVTQPVRTSLAQKKSQRPLTFGEKATGVAVSKPTLMIAAGLGSSFFQSKVIPKYQPVKAKTFAKAKQVKGNQFEVQALTKVEPRYVGKPAKVRTTGYAKTDPLTPSKSFTYAQYETVPLRKGKAIVKKAITTESKAFTKTVQDPVRQYTFGVTKQTKPKVKYSGFVDEGILKIKKGSKELWSSVGESRLGARFTAKFRSSPITETKALTLIEKSTEPASTSFSKGLGLGTKTGSTPSILPKVIEKTAVKSARQSFVQPLRSVGLPLFKTKTPTKTTQIVGSVVKTKQKVRAQTGFSIRFTSKQKSKAGITSLLQTKSKSKRTYKPSATSFSLASTQSRTKQTFLPALAQTSVPMFRQIPKTKSLTKTGGITARVLPPSLWGTSAPPFIIPPKLPSLRLGGRTYSKSKMTKQPFGYTPSITAQVFGITGKPSSRFFSGLEIRPIMKKTKRRKRKSKGRNFFWGGNLPSSSTSIFRF